MQQELMSMTEIRELLGVVRQRAHQITRYPGFPPPIGKVGRLNIWDGTAVRQWAAAREHARDALKRLNTDPSGSDAVAESILDEVLSVKAEPKEA